MTEIPKPMEQANKTMEGAKKDLETHSQYLEGEAEKLQEAAKTGLVRTSANQDQEKEVEAQIQANLKKEMEAKERKEARQNIPVLANEQGVLIGTSIKEQFTLASYYHASKFLPKAYDSPQKILAGMQFAFELGLKPLTALRQTAIIKGTPSLFGDLPLALVMKTDKLISKREIFIDKNQEEICLKNKNLASPVWAAVCFFERRGGMTVERYFSEADRKAAGLNSDAWIGYPAIMMKYRARTAALKDLFADVLNGVSIAEYDFNTIVDNVDEPLIIEHNGQPDIAAELNKKFNS